MTSQPTFTPPSSEDLRAIITNPDGAQKLVEWADRLGKDLQKQDLSTSQIRALFGEVRLIQAQWSINRQRAFRRLVLLQPKMAYRARKERGRAVEDLVRVLRPALEMVIKAPPRPKGEKAPLGSLNNYQDDNFQRFTEFFEAILAYHKAYGGK